MQARERTCANTNVHAPQQLQLNVIVSFDTIYAQNTPTPTQSSIKRAHIHSFTLPVVADGLVNVATLNLGTQQQGGEEQEV